MDPSNVEIRNVSSISKGLLSEEENNISAGVEERRRKLRAFANSPEWKARGIREYREVIVERIKDICIELRLAGNTSGNGDVRFPVQCQISISRDPRSASLFGDPGSIYESINLVEWLMHLPEFAQQCLGKTFSRLNYGQQDCTWMAHGCVLVLEMICNELRGVKAYENHRMVVDGKPQALSEEEVARIRRHLSEAVDEWYCLGVEPPRIAEELLATILFSTELQTEGMESIISHSEIHGKNPSLHGVIRWSLQVFRESEKAWDNEKLKVLEKTIQLFLPIIARIDVFLSRLPVDYTMLFRGISAHIPASTYKAGGLIPWTAFHSLTEDLHPVHEFGCTLFIAHVYNAPTIDFATMYPEKAEHLMPTYTWVKAVNVMSPTLLRILGSTCNYITMQSVGNELTMDELIERLVQKEEYRLRIFEKFVSRYVEASVHPASPPLPHDAKGEPLFEAIQTFLLSQSLQHLLLLGSGGSGKTSALLAVYCELSRQSQSIRGKPVIPIFVSLPSLAIGSEGPIALDRALLNHLGVSPRNLQEISTRCELVVLLDSLDECGDYVKTWLPLLDGTDHCCNARVIVSCRAEWFSDQMSPSSEISTNSEAGACGVLHIQPLSRHQVELFLHKVSVEMTRPVTIDNLLSLGLPEELLNLPVALTMGVEVVQKQRLFGDSFSSVPFLDFACLEQTRVGFYCAHMNACRFRSERGLLGSTDMKVAEVLDAENTARLRKALQDVAITMLARGKWKLSVLQVRILFEKYFGSSRVVVDDALYHSPMRLESLDDPDAEFSFWHKSIGEFLCSTALWGNDSKKYLEMTATDHAAAFSKHELGVLSFFNELATPMEHRKKICDKILLEALLESRDSKKSFLGSKAVLASNAMALLAASQYPLQGVDLRNLAIKNCLVYEGNFRNALLDGTYFEDCDLNRSDFEGASVEGTEFIQCIFGPLKQAPLKGHTKMVNSVCWSPDSKLVASGSNDATIRLWEVATGREVKKLEGHAHCIVCACWSPDGKLIASGSWDNSIRVWDIGSGREVKKLEGHGDFVYSVCWSPDGKLIASGSYDNTIRVWQAASGLEVMKLEGHTDYVRSVLWSPDGKLIASGSYDKTIRVWEVASGDEVKKLVGHASYVESVCWSPDGKLLTSGSDDKTIRVWDFGSGHEVNKLEGHTNSVTAVCWSPDGGLVASGSWDNTIRVWEIASGKEVKKFEGHTSYVWSVCWSPDSMLVASGSRDNSIRVWDVASGLELKHLEGHTDSVWSVCWSPDGKLIASGSGDKSIRVWEVRTGEGEGVVQTDAFSARVPCLILGRQPAGMPPFTVHGEPGIHSRSKPFLSDYLFRTRHILEETFLFTLTP